MSISVYTDGACKKNPGRGGWGFVVVHDDVIIHQASGNENPTTNNRMEMTAVVKALTYIKEGSIEKADIYVDSKYVYDGITSWIIKWKKKSWKNSMKKDVLNADLWREMDALNSSLNVAWKWVKGHSGDKWNDAVDKIASDACKI